MSIGGIGYQSLDLDGLVSRLKIRDVNVLVDVRLNAVSRKRGFSKRALAERLTAEGVEYRHMPSLGNHRNNRSGYSNPEGADPDGSREIFRSALLVDPAAAAIVELSELSQHKKVLLFCFEEDEGHCHREQILQAVMTHQKVRTP